MKVSELIAKLWTYPQDTEVIVRLWTLEADALIRIPYNKEDSCLDHQYGAVGHHDAVVILTT